MSFKAGEEGSAVIVRGLDKCKDKIPPLVVVDECVASKRALLEFAYCKIQ